MHPHHIDGNDSQYELEGSNIIGVLGGIIRPDFSGNLSEKIRQYSESVVLPRHHSMFIAELIAHVTSLQDSLLREQRAAHELQQILSSTEVATLYVDDHLDVRLYNVATRSLFKVSRSDIGRPIAAIASSLSGCDLKADCELVMATERPLEREVISNSGVWYRCRVSPCAADSQYSGGAVITFADRTAWHHAQSVADAATAETAAANAARIKALDDASHDLRQPLQSLAVIQALLVRAVGHEAIDRLAERLAATLSDLHSIADKMRSIPPEPDDVRVSDPLGSTPTQHDASKPLADVIFVVDDDNCVRESLGWLLESAGQTVEMFSSCEDFLRVYRPGRDACLLIDAHLPGMSGLTLLKTLREMGEHVPSIVMTGSGSASTAVTAFKFGASDFLEKPFQEAELIASIRRAMDEGHELSDKIETKKTANKLLAGLTPRQHEILARIIAGQPNKIIAADLDISQRTVENHRASIMKRTKTKSLPALARLFLASNSA